MKYAIKTKTHIVHYEPKLGEILTSRGMTQSEFADRLGLPQGTISRFDRVTQHRDAYELLIAHELGITINELYNVRIEKIKAE